jgi:hypothetical protein
MVREALPISVTAPTPPAGTHVLDADASRISGTVIARIERVAVSAGILDAVRRPAVPAPCLPHPVRFLGKRRMCRRHGDERTGSRGTCKKEARRNTSESKVLHDLSLRSKTHLERQCPRKKLLTNYLTRTVISLYQAGFPPRKCALQKETIEYAAKPEPPRNEYGYCAGGATGAVCTFETGAIRGFIWP